MNRLMLMLISHWSSNTLKCSVLSNNCNLLLRAGIVAGLSNHKNVVCLVHNEKLRVSANAITCALHRQSDTVAESQEITEEVSSEEGN